MDPESSIIYVPSISYTRVLKLVKPDPNRSDMNYLISLGRVSGPSGLPLFKPPYSRITAIDLKTGTHTWMKPIGKGVENHRKLKELNIPPTGGGGWAFPLVTKTLLIAGHSGNLLAMDKATGELIGDLSLRDAGALGTVSGAPMTYIHEGKQYIALALTANRGKARLVALALP